METSKNRRWLVIGLVVTLGLVLAAIWPLQDPEGDTESGAGDTDAAAVGVADTSSTAPHEERADGGVRGRRITPGCRPDEESLKYEEFIDRRALTILSWNGMPERTANLRIPIRVVGVEGGMVGVRFLQFPMREQYLNVWLGSEHIKAGGEGVFLLDPCSATIVAWPEMERGAAEDAD